MKAHPALFGREEEGEPKKRGHYYASLQLTYAFKTLEKTHKKTPKFRPSQEKEKYRKKNKTYDLIKILHFPSAKPWKMAHFTVFP